VTGSLISDGGQSKSGYSYILTMYVYFFCLKQSAEQLVYFAVRAIME